MGNEFVNHVSLPILNIEFNIALDNNKYPYVSENSIYEEDIVLSKLTINVESDYTSWLEILERILQRNKIRGVYSNQCLYDGTVRWEKNLHIFASKKISVPFSTAYRFMLRIRIFPESIL